MEFAEENLAEILENRPLTPDETRDMLLQVASALDYLHSQGMSHGDLKACEHSGDRRHSQTLQRIHRQRVMPAADIRALGSTLIYALTQRRKRSRTTTLERREKSAGPLRRNRAGCLNPDPSLRWTAKKIIPAIA